MAERYLMEARSLLVFLRPFCRPRLVSCMKERFAVSLRPRKLSTYSRAARRLGENIDETSSGVTKGMVKNYFNRNPRSPELLGIAEKPRGFITWKRRVDYYHRLMLEVSGRHVSAYVNHNNGKKVVEASTREFCISRHLYKTSDVSAAFNIGRVIAARCKEAGLKRVMWEHKWNRTHKKTIAFIKGIQLEGLILNEPKQRKQIPQPGTIPR